jgi:hypothetical protein
MRKRSRLLLALVLTPSLLMLPATPALALPSSTADNGVYMVNGPRVDDIVRVGGNTWLGGNFSQVQNQNGVNVDAAPGLAVFDASGVEINSIQDNLPNLNGSNRDVYDLSLSPTNGILYAAGTFTYACGTKTCKNLIGIDPTTGAVAATYVAPSLRSVLATDTFVYAGGKKLQRYPLTGGKVDGTWHSITAYLDPNLRTHTNNPFFRGIDVADSSRLIVVGQFDWIDATDDAHQKKVAVMVDTATGLPDLGPDSWKVPCSCAAQTTQSYGLAVQVVGDVAYIGAGGNDFAAAVKISDDSLIWQTDTNGSTQDIAAYDSSTVIIGGHYTSIEVSGPGDEAGSECPNRSLADQSPCWLQPRLAAVDSSTGLAIQSWTPAPCCIYGGVWATMVDGTTVHVGGEFTKLDPKNVDAGPENYYGRYSVSI